MRGERFAIPQICVVELVHASSQSEHRIERINNTPVLRLRNHLLPLVSLRETLRLDEDKKTSDTAFIVVIQIGSSTFGCIVDRVFDTEESSLSPSRLFCAISICFPATPFWATGSVVMILDPNGLASHAGQIHASASVIGKQVAQTTQGAHGEGKQSLLLFRAGGVAPKAVPLSLIARLEEIEIKTVRIFR